MQDKAPVSLPKKAVDAELAGKSALVTGSTSGIGLGIARAFGAAGMNVMLNGFGDAGAIAALRKEIEGAYGVKTAFSGADMTKPGEIAKLVADTQAAFGQLDVLVNNAGIQHVSPVEEFPIDKWDAIIAINLSSAFHTTRAALPAMKQRGYGRIINLCSAHGLVASPFKSAYVAAKHGILGFTKTIALETAEHGVTVNAICPGYVRTPLVDKQIPDTAKARGISEEAVIRDVILKAQPTHRFVAVEEIGAIAVFLCGSGAASITGASISVDGGWTAQ